MDLEKRGSGEAEKGRKWRMHARLALKTFRRTLLCYKKRVQVTYFFDSGP